MSKCNARGLAIIKEFESCKLEAYKCPAGVWTIGYGHTGPDVKPGVKITQAQAEQLLLKDVERFEAGVRSLLQVAVTSNQFSALVSFAFNCGLDIDADNLAEGLGDSTLLRKVNARDFAGAADEFRKWNKAGGTVLNGLTRRREAERALFLSS